MGEKAEKILSKQERRIKHRVQRALNKRQKKAASLEQERAFNVAMARKFVAQKQLEAQKIEPCRAQLFMMGLHPSKSKKLCNPSLLRGLQLINLNRSEWIRNISDWSPKGKNSRSLLRSLIKHLFVKYPVPEFFYHEVFIEGSAWKEVPLFLHLAQGGSLYEACQSGLFPVPLTKRMCHYFMQATSDHTLMEALRYAQVKAFGGSRRVAEALVHSRRLGSIGADEDFWSGVIQWFCNQDMLDPNTIDPILDWVAEQRRVNPTFSMKGRTGVSVHAAMVEWHDQLMKIRDKKYKEYSPSGLSGWEELVEKEQSVSLELTTITEILSSKELALEGNTLRHCVYSYSTSIEFGRVSLWSFQLNGRRTLTIEVDTHKRKVVQVRGFGNSLPTQRQMEKIKSWASKNNLRVGKLPIKV